MKEESITRGKNNYIKPRETIGRKKKKKNLKARNAQSAADIKTWMMML